MVGGLDTLRVPMFEGLGVWVEGFGFRPPSARPLQHRIPFTRFEIVRTRCLTSESGLHRPIPSANVAAFAAPWCLEAHPT